MYIHQVKHKETKCHRKCDCADISEYQYHDCRGNIEANSSKPGSVVHLSLDKVNVYSSFAIENTYSEHYCRSEYASSE